MRRVIIIAGCLAVAFLIGIVALVVLENPQARVAEVRTRFEQIPNVKLTYISDLTKQASQLISADMEVSGKGEMSFCGLGTDSFGNASHIRLSGIGPYSFRTRELMGGREAYGYDIEIGPSSPIPAVRSLGITSVQSAVARYDELLALVSPWPVTTNEWPSGWPPKKGEWSKKSDEEIHFADLPRGDFYFCLKR
ncbi:MAG: hypothetical protein ACO1QS_12675 [Verrucomicrobiota bacterium]